MHESLDLRLWRHPILDFERGKPVGIYLNGERIVAYEGETIAAALYASGVKVYSRTVKYRRPRGFFCGIGKCSSCLMRVDGMPHVRTCITPVKNDMKIEYEKDLGETPATSEMNVEEEEIETDILVVGGGPAGLSAAITAANLGANVVIVDENPEPGGQLTKQSHKFFGSKENYASIRGTEIAKILLRDLQTANVDWLVNASAIGYYEGKKHHLAVVQNNQRLIEIDAERLIVATGARENMLAFPNNDLPGIYGAGGVQTVMNVYGVKPGNDALIVGAGNVGLIVGYQLIQAGVNVRMVVEATPKIGGYHVHAAKIRRLGVPILTRHTITAAEGDGHVETATVARLDESWQPVKSTEQGIHVDLVCLAVGLTPSSELLFQAGCEQAYVPELGGQVAIHNDDLETTLDGVYVAGDVSAIEEASTAMMEGRIAGANVAMDLGKKTSVAEETKVKSLKDLEALRASAFSEKVQKGKKKVWNLWREKN